MGLGGPWLEWTDGQKFPVFRGGKSSNPTVEVVSPTELHCVNTDHNFSTSWHFSFSPHSTQLGSSSTVGMSSFKRLETHLSI